MTAILRIWPEVGANVWWCDFDDMGSDHLEKLHTMIKETVASWESAPHWQRVGERTWRNTQTGERIEFIYIETEDRRRGFVGC